MAFSTAGGRPFQAEINVTPMIDVLLVLIIVFMVVVSMSQKEGLKAEIPQPANGPQMPAPRTIVIQLNWTPENQAPSVKINDDAVKWEDLHDRLFDVFKQRAEKVAFVKGDDDVDFQYVADAISIARGSGVERVGLLTKTGPEAP
jgi:biopolymer transport protein TolR